MAPDQSNIHRTNSISQSSEISQTAQEYIQSQLKLEAEAREALPYQFDTCTRPLGPLRQSLFACLTCNPPPASPAQVHTPAGVCYSCSISCHGEHTLVELFLKRDFVCDCGTKRLPEHAPCTLQLNGATGRKGDVKGQEPRKGNKYNQNFQGRFCGCGEEYDPEKEKGTMFQCLGLGHVEDGGCGEDWWHPECLMGLPRNKDGVKKELHKKEESVKQETNGNGTLHAIPEEGAGADLEAHESASQAGDDHEEVPLPDGFPNEDDFDQLICYKCVEAFPWIKQYAGTPGFLPAVPHQSSNGTDSSIKEEIRSETNASSINSNGKRAVEDDLQDYESSKRVKTEPEAPAAVPPTTSQPKHTTLPPAPSGRFSLFLQSTFRDNFCRCPTCFPQLSTHPQLLEEEETYEPPVSESDHEEAAGTGSVGSRSLLERGEAALSGLDRVRAIEGVMAYNQLKDKVKSFLQPFAESGTPVGAEDIKAYFAKLRGDDEAMKAAAAGAEGGGGDGGGDGDGRREQGGY